MNEREFAVRQRVEECQGLVRSLAAGIHRTLPRQVDIDDLIGYGQVGLAEAARDFDPSRGSKFSTFAYYRIRGAIYDGLTKLAWHSRAHYRRVRYEQMADDLLRMEGETAGAAETSQGLQGGAHWLGRMSRALTVVYLATHADEEKTHDSAMVDRAKAPPEVAMQRETISQLRGLVEALPKDAEILIKSTYFEGMNLKQAAERLGISKAWASRLHAKTLQRLGRALRLLGVSHS